MNAPSRKPALWVDELIEKHECGGYGQHVAPERVSLDLDGRQLTLVSPFEFEPLHVVSSTFAESGDLLYLISKVPQRGEPLPYVGLMVIARRGEGDVYSVVVWHVLSGWALDYLGLLNGGES